MQRIRVWVLDQIVGVEFSGLDMWGPATVLWAYCSLPLGASGDAVVGPVTSRLAMCSLDPHESFRRVTLICILTNNDSFRSFRAFLLVAGFLFGSMELSFDQFGSL